MTNIFHKSVYEGTVGATLDPAVEVGTGGSLTAGAGTATYQSYAGGKRAQYNAAKRMIRAGTYPNHWFATWTWEQIITPGGPNTPVQYTFFDYRATGGVVQGEVQMGIGGNVSLLDNTGTRVATTKARYDLSTGQYVIELEVWQGNPLGPMHYLKIFTTEGVMLDAISGPLGGSAIVDTREGIGAAAATTAMFYYVDNTNVTTDYQPYDYGALAQACFSLVPTADDQIIVNARTTGCDQTRLYIPELHRYSPAQNVPQDDYRMTYHTVFGLPKAQHDYAYVLQGLVNGAWVDLDNGVTRTAPSSQRGTGVSPTRYRKAIVACQLTSALDHPGNPVVFDHIAAQAGDLDAICHLGDSHYDNDDVGGQHFDVLIYFWDLIRQVKDFTGFSDLLKTFAAFITYSDHEIGNNFQNGGSPSTLALLAAWRLLFPQYPSPLLTEEAFCWSRIVGDDICEVYIDERNYNRSDSDLVDWKSPSKRMMGPEQMAFLLGKINERHRFTIVHSDMVWLPAIDGSGNEVQLSDKTDAWPSYWVDMLTVAAAMEANPNGLFVQGDMHSINWTDSANVPHGHWAIAGSAGIDKDAIWRGGEYDQYWPPTADIQINPNIPINVWGDLVLTDFGDQIQVDFTGWDCGTTPGTPIARVVGTKTYDVPPHMVAYFDKHSGFPRPIMSTIDGVSI